MSDARVPAWRAATVAAIVLGAMLRFSCVLWTDPWSPHHPDEHILPAEALALWEGVAPRELGWPASTTRLALSGVLAVQWTIEQGWDAWQNRHDIGSVLNGISVWIGERFVEPSALYRTGRAVSVITGLLQLLATAWALARWTGPAGVAIGTLAVAISPLAVTYSQYVLADITGLLFTTLAVGLAARPDARSVLVMSGFAALAAMSKFHFGLWVLMPLACIWLSESTAGSRCRLTLLATGIIAWVVLTLWPWTWTNPLLAIKEFISVVALKVTSGSTDETWSANLFTVFGGLGLMTWFGALVAVPALVGETSRRLAPVLIPVVLGTIALATSAVVFDRYGLVLLPGLVVMLAVGVTWWMTILPTRALAGAAAVAIVCGGWTAASLATAMREAGEADVDALARDWVLAHVPRGRRVAVYNEMSAFLPRTHAQLQACADRVGSQEEFAEKWLLLNFTGLPVESRPFRAALLSHEMFYGYRCRRELAVAVDPGYTIVWYHPEPRYGAVLERDAIMEFAAGRSEVSGGIDVLIAMRPLAIGVQPAYTIRTMRGRRFIYVR
jgi:hypothetical protein